MKKNSFVLLTKLVGDLNEKILSFSDGKFKVHQDMLKEGWEVIILGMDQYMYAVKNGVYDLKNKINWNDPLVDKIFVPATEIGYWRKNTALQHYFYTQCAVYTKISKQQLEQLMSNIERRWGEFDYPDYIRYNKEYDLEVINNALGYISDDFSIYYEADW